MENITYSDFKKHLDANLDKVNIDRVAILIRRRAGKSVVIMSQDDFNSYEETAHLMSSINNVKRLNRSIKQLESGKGKIRGLIEHLKV